MRDRRSASEPIRSCLKATGNFGWQAPYSIGNKRFIMLAKIDAERSARVAICLRGTRTKKGGFLLAATKTLPSWLSDSEQAPSRRPTAVRMVSGRDKQIL